MPRQRGSPARFNCAVGRNCRTRWCNNILDCSFKNVLQVRELCRPDYDSAEKAKKLPPTASVSAPVPRRRGTLPHTRRIATEVERSEQPSARSMSRNSSHGGDNTRETTANKRREPRAKAPPARRKLDNRPAWMTHQSNPRNIGMSSRGIADAHRTSRILVS